VPGFIPYLLIQGAPVCAAAVPYSMLHCLKPSTSAAAQAHAAALQYGPQAAFRCTNNHASVDNHVPSCPASGGERKRVSVGHELLINPAVLLLDGGFGASVIQRLCCLEGCNPGQHDGDL